MRNVQNAAVLYISTGTNADLIHITPDRNQRPDAHVVPHYDITDHNTAWIDHNALASLRERSLYGRRAEAIMFSFVLFSMQPDAISGS